jgi:hypothetical protein
MSGAIGRRSLALTVLGMGLCCLLFSRSARSLADWRPGRNMAKAVAGVMDSARLLPKDIGYDNGICILGAFVRKGASVSFKRHLVSGERYTLLGGGGDLADDVDIYIVDSSGKVVAKDTDADATPVVGYVPTFSGEYSIRLNLYEASGSEFCALVILREGGWNVPVSNLVTATGKCIIACNLIADAAGGARFHDEPNQWSLFGSILREGESVSVTNLTMERRRHAIVAAGDNNVDDLDLFLLGPNGQTLEKDIRPDSFAVIDYRTGNHTSYGLRIKNESSYGATLVLASVLDL